MGSLASRRRCVKPIIEIVILGALLVACNAFPPAPIKLTFVNETDSLLCYGSSSADAASGCQEVKARRTTVWRPGCGTTGKLPMSVVLTLGQGGAEVYNRTATCNEWDSGGKFVIEQAGDDFVVTDSLPGSVPGP